MLDRQWRHLAPLLPDKPRGVPRADERRVISGIIHVLRPGGRWVDAPVSYGLRKTLRNNAIERMFCRLTDFRRIATRYDKLATNFLAAVQLAAMASHWL
ncbi:MAG TPA: transposase [Roseomonas sp.]|nr:transposase [Roseomonas sp.]